MKKTMTYSIHIHDEIHGWHVSKESLNLDTFGDDDKWAFNFILENECEYVKMGDTMWTIEQG